MDWEAAEKAYRAAVAEVSRMANQGITTATPTLKGVAGGFYLKVQLAGLKEIKSQEWHTKGETKILQIRRDGGYDSDELSFVSCEDNSSLKAFDKNGRDVTPKNTPDYIQELTVIKTGARWKVMDFVTQKVANVSASDCEA